MFKEEWGCVFRDCRAENKGLLCAPEMCLGWGLICDIKLYRVVDSVCPFRSSQYYDKRNKELFFQNGNVTRINKFYRIYFLSGRNAEIMQKNFFFKLNMHDSEGYVS